MHSPLFTSHSLMVPSTEPLAKYFLSGLATTELTTSECPFKIRMHSPLFTSHNLRVSSSEPLAKYFPSGLASTQLTLLEFPFKVRNNRKSFGESDSIVEVCSRLFCSSGISFCVYFAKIKNFHIPTKFSFFFSTNHADLHEYFYFSFWLLVKDNKTTSQRDYKTCGLVVPWTCSLFAKTKRAFANAKAGRTLVCLYLTSFVPPFRGLEDYSMPQILTVLSVEPLIIFVPSGVQQTEVTRFECPLKVRIHTPLFASHILMVESTEPLAK